MKVLVTGANGHIGSNVVRALLKAHHDVRGMLRQVADTRGLDGLAFERVYGDIRDMNAVEAAMRGCDVVINLATPYITQPENPADVIDPAMDSVRNVLQAAAKLRIQKVIHASSATAIGTSKNPSGLRSEKDWRNDGEMPYTTAKVDSERIAWTLAEALEVPLVCLNPPIVLGRFDYRITPSTRWVFDMLEGTTILPKGAMCPVHVLDVAAAFVSAIQHGRAGERYIISGPSVSFKDLATLIKTMTGKGPGYSPAPRPVVLGFVGLQYNLLRLLGRPALANVAAAREWVHRYQVLDTTKANTDLGLSSHSAQEIIEEVIEWGMYLKAFTPQTTARLKERFPSRDAWD